MGRDEAAKLEGMIAGARMFLQAVADYVLETVPDEQRRQYLVKIGTAMAELIDVSRAIYDEHPHLDPHSAAPHADFGKQIVRPSDEDN